MPRLLVHVEGYTEETFVNEVLARHLFARGYERVDATLVGNARQRQHRGGSKSWSSVKKEIVAHLKEDAGRVVTTMVDFYGLPQNGPTAWPGRAQANDAAGPTKAPMVEAALSADISSEMGVNFRAARFIPFVMMHEFEGLLFSDCAAFARGIYRTNLEGGFQTIRDQFETPEDINDSPTTAPSKRILRLLPEYDKVLFGSLAVLEIGLEKIREACPHFRGWLGRLEAQAAQ